MKAAVIIPIYKEEMDENEKKSLKQCLQVLQNYQVYFITFPALNTNSYKSFIAELGDSSSFQFVYFDSCYFNSIDGYNELMLSRLFYKTFLAYDYILLYQLDAYVFRDELKEWCQKGYDYIGAPWFESFSEDASYHFLGVGNGGFSLRRPKAMLKVINKWTKFYSFGAIYNKVQNSFYNKRKLLFSLFLEFLRIRKKEFSLFPFYRHINEDAILGLEFGKKFKLISVPGEKEAAKFAFEVHAEYLYGMNKRELPFGCHAWYRYEEKFWQGILQASSAD